ncbi:hypothetical protein M1N60_01265 [Thermodesulfovibrionales bacterium]|nr:hypothetical protein [Thermodesulfovibrionales bacterium]
MDVNSKLNTYNSKLKMMSYYIHNVPGRLRVKSPAIKNNAIAVDELKMALSTMEGIATTDINLITGSLLVNYNPKAVKQNDIVAVLERRGYFDASRAMTQDEYLQKAALEAGQIVGRAVLGSFVENALKGSPLAILTLLI